MTSVRVECSRPSDLIERTTDFTDLPPSVEYYLRGGGGAGGGGLLFGSDEIMMR